MAKTATRAKAKPTASKPKARAGTAPGAKRGGTKRASSGPGAADAFVNLLQSPLVADLVAVAATAALAALAEHGFNSGGGAKKTAGKAVKEAGKAAAAAVGRRLGTEVDAIRESAKAKKAKRA